MALGKIEYWIVAQMTLEVLLLIVVICFIYKIRQLNRHRLEPQEIKAILKESHLLKDQLLDNLQAKKDIIHNLVKQLDLRIKAAQELAQTLEKRITSARRSCRLAEESGPQSPETTLLERIAQLHQQGYEVDEIGRLLHMSKGEVLLGLDLARAKDK